MREIKFRGKRIDNGEWVCGLYVIVDMKHYICLCIKSDTKIENVRYEVDPETVGQCFKVCGKEICEGDIIAYSWEEKGHLVVFGNEGSLETDFLIVWGQDDGYKIIGNMFDNPELYY